MRVCIVGIQNIKHMTLISLYTTFFEKNKIEYDLVYIDKYGIDEDNNAKNLYKFDGTKKIYSSKIGKIIKALAFKKFAIKILDGYSYDFVVVWREQTAYMLSRYLSIYYNNKYSVNIRDLWNMNNKLITKGVKKAVRNSAFNTISSEGFLKYLPHDEYLMLHSANKKILSKNQIIAGNETELPIKITYIGTVRFYNYCFRLVDFFANDKRFELQFIGQDSDIIEKYALEKKIDNVVCIGRFEPENTIELLKGTHIINCAFGSQHIAEQMLLPIRFYYAIYGEIPVLTVENTWLHSLASRLEMEITIPSNMDESHITANDVYNSYRSIKWEKMKRKINQYKMNIDKSHEEFEKILKQYLKVK